MTDFQQGLVGIYGYAKTAKTTLALTAPKPLFHFDFDEGFARAESRFSQFKIRKLAVNTVPDLADLADADIITLPIRQPLLWPGQKVAGLLALREIVDQTLRLITDNASWIRTVALDTGSLFWTVTHGGRLEELRNLSKHDKQTLHPTEYAEPNSRIRAYLTNIRAAGKTAILTHHTRDVRMVKVIKGQEEEVKVGETWEGWSHLDGLVDVLVRTHKEERFVPGKGKTQNPYMEIVTCGWSLDAEGQRVDNHSWDGLLTCINEKRGQNGTGNL